MPRQSDSLVDRRQQPWAMVENELLRDPRISPQCKALYGLLITYGPQSIFPGQETLAQCLGTTRQTVKRWLDDLKLQGLIDWENRTGTSNRYYILGYANFHKGVIPVLQGCNTSVTGGVTPTLHDLEPLTQNQEPERPPPADSSDIAETAALFKPPPPRQKRTTEQVKADIQRAIQTFEEKGGRPGVADPTQDDAWADKPLRAFCVLVGQDVDQLKDSKRRDWPRQLEKWARTFGHTVSPQEAFQCIRGITKSEFNWMSFTSPRQTTFQETMDIMVSRLRGGKPFDAGINGGSRNGGASGPRTLPNGFRAMPKTARPNDRRAI